MRSTILERLGWAILLLLPTALLARIERPLLSRLLLPVAAALVPFALSHSLYRAGALLGSPLCPPANCAASECPSKALAARARATQATQPGKRQRNSRLQVEQSRSLTARPSMDFRTKPEFIRSQVCCGKCTKEHYRRAQVFLLGLAICASTSHLSLFWLFSPHTLPVVFLFPSLSCKPDCRSLYAFRGFSFSERLLCCSLIAIAQMKTPGPGSPKRAVAFNCASCQKQSHRHRADQLCHLPCPCAQVANCCSI